MGKLQTWRSNVETPTLNLDESNEQPKMYTGCFYCGRTNHMENNCHYKDINLAKITRDPNTKKLKKHFNPKPHTSEKEDKNLSKATKSAKTNPPQISSVPSPSASTAPGNYLRCKDCVKWQMRLHQQANYWREENRQFKNQHNIIDDLAKENKKLNDEIHHWKNLYYLRDRDGIDKHQFVKRSKAKN